VIMLNASASAARDAIAQGIVKPYLGVRDVDWLQYIIRENEQAAAAELTEEPEVIDFRHGSVDAPLGSYAGLYRDPWFGDVSIELIDGDLWFVSDKSPKMKGRLWPYEGHTFYAYWADQTLEADAFVTFEIDATGNSLRMDVEQVSEEADWDFTDLDLPRVTDE